MPAKESTNRDTVLSDYVRYRIREWLRAGGEQKALAELAKLRPSAIAMIKGGQGVGAKSAPKLAKAFGFESVPSMVDAAYEWRKGLGESLDRRLADPAFQAGLSAVSLIMPPPSDVELRTIVADFVSPRFDGREPQWWATTLGTELSWDRSRSIDPEVRAADENLKSEWWGKYRERGHVTKDQARAISHAALVRESREGPKPEPLPTIEPKRKRAR